MCSAALGLLAAQACRQPARAPLVGDFRRLDTAVLLDPQLVWLDPGAAGTSFDGRPSSLRGGPGWYFPEAPGTGPWASAAWSARSSSRYFEWPSDGDLELHLKCAPFAWPGSPPQSVEPQVNGVALGTQRLEDNWSDLQFRVPLTARRAGLNRLDLSFGHEASPSEVLGSSDFRFLAAACDTLWLAPPSAPPWTPASSGSTRLAGGQPALRLDERPIALRLPPATAFRVRLGATVEAPPGARLVAELLTADGSRRSIWRGPAGEAADETHVVSCPSTAAPRLLLRAESDEGSPATVVAPPQVEAAVEPAPRRPDIFVYLIDTLRRDALGAYEPGSTLTPQLDAFARQAITFDRAWSTSSWTLPATVSLLSGLLPTQHGIVDTAQRIDSHARPWLQDVLRDAGYETIGVSQWLLGNSVYGIDRGFDAFYFDTALLGKRYSDGARWYVASALLDRTESRPKLVYVHVTDPHAPYRPEGDDLRLAARAPGRLPEGAYDPLEFQRRGLAGNRMEVAHLRALYDGAVARADREFGAFLDLLRFAGVYDDSVIVVAADHGEEFAEHGGFDHGRTLYEELVHIPLLVKLPGGRGGGTRSAEPVSLIDIAPTLASLAGAPPGSFPGRVLPLPGAPARERGPQPALLAEVVVPASADLAAVNLEAVLAGDVKCVRNRIGRDRFGHPAPPLEAFDLRRDPSEQHPLPTIDPRRAECAALLDRQWASLERPAAAPHASPLAPEDAAHLRALGYIR